MLEMGYILLHRSLLSWEWYDDPNTFRLFAHLLLTVNYEPKQWRGITVGRGQRVYSRAGLAKELGLSERSVRTALDHLKSTGEATSQTTSRFSIITVSNYEKYQNPTGQTTDGRPTGDQPATSDRPQCKKANKANKANNTGERARAREGEKYGEFGMVTLTSEQYGRLVQRLGKDMALRYIERLDGHIASKGAHYDDHYATILNWWRKDRDKPAPKQNPSAQTGGNSSIDMGKISAILHQPKGCDGS